MIKRQIRQQVHDTLQHIAAVVLLGPRQIGKTTLDHEVAGEFACPLLHPERKHSSIAQLLVLKLIWF